jgi:hypothetical protein
LQDGARGHVRRWHPFVRAALAPMWFDLPVTKDACLDFTYFIAQMHKSTGMAMGITTSM